MFKNILEKIFHGEKIREQELEKTKQQAKEIILKANEEALKLKQEAEREGRSALAETLEMERRLAKKEQLFEDKGTQFEKEKALFVREKQSITALKISLEEKRDLMLKKLEKAAAMTKEQARELLLTGWEEKLRSEVVKMIKAKEDQIKQTVDEKAKEILVDAMRYGATDYVAEYTLSVINLPNEDFKGRIIGKDGRNIRAFELAAGVDVDLEEEGTIKVSSFDAIRREIARLSLEKLIKDGRIQPERIEQIISKTKEEVDKIIFRAGEELAHKIGVFNLPSEIVRLLGKFKYRYSYGQNMIVHTLEETQIGVALANELKVDINVVKLGCLLHDIGKVIADKEGSHIGLGVELLKKYHFPQKVIDCVASHHEDVSFSSIEAVIVYISDAVSGGRPGARHEDFQEYLKRITTIEEIAKSKKGVSEAYALQAGRELRVILKPEDISEDEAVILAEKIKEELEKKFEVFPGQIKITVIREFRTEALTKI